MNLSTQSQQHLGNGVSNQHSTQQLGIRAIPPSTLPIQSYGQASHENEAIPEMMINGMPNVAVPMQPQGDYRAGVQNIQGMPIANQMQQYVPVDATTLLPGGTQVAIQQGVNGAGQPYYVQPPVYLDQNGQPVYYRVGA